MAIKQQLQVTNFVACLGWSKPGSLVIVNIELYNRERGHQAFSKCISSFNDTRRVKLMYMLSNPCVGPHFRMKCSGMQYSR